MIFLVERISLQEKEHIDLRKDQVCDLLGAFIIKFSYIMYSSETQGLPNMGHKILTTTIDFVLKNSEGGGHQNIGE